MSIDLKNLTIKKVHESMKSGEFSAVELTQAYLDVIKEKNTELNAYLEVFEKSALKEAEEADKKFKEGSATLLTGIPIAVKDNILIEGKIASAASKILENYKATYDATVIKKLKEEGAVFLGRTNLDEFAMGSSTDNSAFGVVKNPHDTSRVAGGSSGGSAAAVASNMCLVALGTDTGGSVRQPSSFCGVVGFKPTYGNVSRSGLIALGSSLDVVGIIAKGIDDVEIVFDVIKGLDELDSTSKPENLYKKEKSKKVVGVPVFEENIDLDDAKMVLQELGYEVKEIDLSHMKYSLPTYYVILPAEISANLARFDGVKYGLRKDGENLIETYLNTRGEGFGSEPKRRILLGTYVLSAGYHGAYYDKATMLRDKIREEFEEAFKSVDFILMPTTPGPAFKIGEKVDDPVSMYLEDMFTVPANITGVPAVSVPFGSRNNLPLGIQFFAPHQREDMLFKIGKDFESFNNNPKA